MVFECASFALRRAAARGLGTDSCVWHYSLLQCTGCKGKHAQKRRKYSNSESGECWRSCESMRSSGRECLMSVFRKYLMTQGVHNVLKVALTWEECSSPLHSWGKHGEGQRLDIYVCAAMVRGEQLCPWCVQVMRTAYSDSVISAADSAATVGDSARHTLFLAFIKHSSYPDNRPPWSQSKSETTCKPRSPDLLQPKLLLMLPLCPLSLPKSCYFFLFPLPCKLMCLSNCFLCYCRSS